MANPIKDEGSGGSQTPTPPQTITASQYSDVWILDIGGNYKITMTCENLAGGTYTDNAGTTEYTNPATLDRTVEHSSNPGIDTNLPIEGWATLLDTTSFAQIKTGLAGTTMPNTQYAFLTASTFKKYVRVKRTLAGDNPRATVTTVVARV